MLHVISNPFPRVWHTLAVSHTTIRRSQAESVADSQDDAAALSMPAMNRWNRILRVFTAEVLGLMPESNAKAHRTADELVRCFSRINMPLALIHLQ